MKIYAHEPSYFDRVQEEKQRICCNCRHDIRIEEKGHINNYCEIDGHYIGYVACFEDWCRHWAKEKE